MICYPLSYCGWFHTVDHLQQLGIEKIDGYILDFVQCLRSIDARSYPFYCSARYC